MVRSPTSDQSRRGTADGVGRQAMMRLDDGISGLLRGGQRRASRKKKKKEQGQWAECGQEEKVDDWRNARTGGWMTNEREQREKAAATRRGGRWRICTGAPVNQLHSTPASALEGQPHLAPTVNRDDTTRGGRFIHHKIIIPRSMKYLLLQILPRGCFSFREGALRV